MCVMKVLIIAPTPFFVSRGTPIRILEEALALERRGHSITLVSYHIGEEISKKIQTHIDHRRIRRWLFWYRKLEAGADWQKILLDIMLLRKVFSLARTVKPDVLYGHLHEGTLIGWVVKKIFFWRKMILVSDFHGGLTAEMMSHGYLRRGLLRRIFWWVERWINGLGDIIVTSSWENTEEIRRTQLTRQRVETVLDGVNSIRYTERAKNREGIRRKWGLPDDCYIFVYAGALLPNKGLFPVISAMKLFLNSEKWDVVFVFAGSPLEYIAPFLEESFFQGHARVISPLNYFDLPELLSVCDVGIDPKDSVTHQASGKILQYMAAGLPVVCFDRANNRQYLGEGGIYCKDSPEGLVEGFRYCLQKKEEILQKGCKNRERVQELSWEKGAEKVENLIFSHLQKIGKGDILIGKGKK